jgi:hypothetical protein
LVVVREAVVLAVDAVICAVGLLHQEELLLHFPDGGFLNDPSNFFDSAERRASSSTEEFRYTPKDQ